MKIIYTLLITFVIVFESEATNYYLSASGNDGNAGTTPASPWKSISKLNTVTYAPGDTVFFKRSEVFPGTIVVNQGGNSSSSLVFTAYGAGDSPIIIGSEDVTGWTASGNYYTAPYTGTVVNFFMNGKEQTLARYPNEHVYLTLDSAQTLYLHDAALTSLNANLINGSGICVHTSQWSWEKANVSSFSGDKITYGSAMLKAINNYGYFLNNNLTHLDTAREWYYDAGAHILYYYPPAGVNPNTKTCSVSVYPNGMELGHGVSHVYILHCAFENQSNAGVQIGNASNQHITIDGCYFSGQYNYGVNAKGKYCRITDSYFREVDGIAVLVTGVGSMVDHTYFINNGVTRENGLGGQLNGTALMCASDSNYFHHNIIDSTGYCGISADGAYNVVERNVINHAMLIENDGAALKGWGPGTMHSIYRNNFISNSDGNTEGTHQAGFVTPAIYFDFSVNNCTIANNTVYNHSKKGIFQNSSNHHNTIMGNVIHGGSFLLDLNGTDLAPSAVPITNMVIKHNSFFSKDNNSLIIRQVDYMGNFNAGTLDSNYYFQPYTPNRYAMRILGMTSTYYTFPSWKATGNDPHTVKSFVSWTYPVSYDTLIMNKTDNSVSINLGTDKFLDLDSNVICGSVILEPYSSKILIATHVDCLTGIEEDINAGQIMLYPNPASHEVRIPGPLNLPVSTYEITDTYGRIVLAGSMDPGKGSVNIQSLSPGLYFITLKNDKIYRAKLIRE